MMDRPLRIATRKSPLAMWQAEHIAARLRSAHPGLQVELVAMSTQGDRILDSPLAKIGGKGLFVKELEQGILEGRADIAVHSMKDVPVALPDGLHLPVIEARHDPHDALVANRYTDLGQLPDAAVVGSSSLRRQCQLLARYPRLRVESLRGNVNTRLAKLDRGDYDAIILAASGLQRLGLGNRIAAVLGPEQSLPAIGQGALGIECRLDDAEINDLVAVLDDPDTHLTVSIERAFNRRLGGGCQVPIAGFAELTSDGLRIRGLVGHPSGSPVYYGERQSSPAEGLASAESLADELLAQGADRVLRELSLPDQP